MAVPRDDPLKRFQVELSGFEGNKRKDLWIKFRDVEELEKKGKEAWMREAEMAHNLWTNRGTRRPKRKNTEGNDNPEKRIKLDASTPTMKAVQQGERATDHAVPEGIIYPNDNVDESKKHIKLEASSPAIKVTQQNEETTIPDDIVDPSTNMNNDQLKQLFLQVSEPFPATAYVRLSKLLQREHNLASPVSTALLKRMRDGAPSWTHDYAAHFLKDPMWVDYLKNAPRAPSPELLASVFCKGDANSKNAPRTAPSKTSKADGTYREYQKKRKGTNGRLAAPVSKFPNAKESDPVPVNNAETSFRLLLGNDEASSKNVPRTAPSKPRLPGNTYRELNATLNKRENIKARQLEDEKSEPVRIDDPKAARQASAPGPDQGISTSRKVEDSSNNAPRAVLSAHSQTSSSTRRGPPKTKVSLGILDAFVARYPEAKERHHVRMVNPETTLRNGWPKVDRSLGQAYQVLRVTEKPHTDEVDAFIVKYFTEAEQSELVRMDQLKRALKRTVMPEPERDEPRLVASYEGLAHKTDALLCEAVIAKHFVKTKESVPERVDNPNSAPRAVAPGTDHDIRPVGEAFREFSVDFRAMMARVAAVRAKCSPELKESDPVREDKPKPVAQAVEPERERPKQRIGQAFRELLVVTDAYYKNTAVLFAKYFPEDDVQE
ncbi:hypothetical protein HBI49_221810 [Parastagonospora nodorum]|nr:hypothetical protein HBI49_221810 [Parastagonospora nodorum]